jgi:hypothetical protein
MEERELGMVWKGRHLTEIRVGLSLGKNFRWIGQVPGSSQIKRDEQEGANE